MFSNTFNFIQTGSNTVLIADLSGLVIANDLLLSGRIDTLSGYILTNSGKIDSLSGQFVGFQSALTATSGYVQSASGYLYGQMTGISGYLNGKIITMSGYFTGVSGNLQAQINNLTTATGVLQSETLLLSGLITGASGVLQTQINNISGGSGTGAGLLPIYDIYNPDNVPTSGNVWTTEWRNSTTGITGVGSFDWYGSGNNLPALSIVGNSLVSRGGLPGDSDACVMLKAIDSGSNWSVTAKVIWNAGYLQTDSIGLIVFSPTLINYRSLLIQQAGTLDWAVQTFIDVNTAGAGVQSEPATGPIGYLRLEKSGIQFTFLKSIDGYAFVPSLVVADYTAIMTDGIESIGIFTNGSYSSCPWVRKDWQPEDSINNPKLFPL